MGPYFSLIKMSAHWGQDYIETRTYTCVYMHIIFISFASQQCSCTPGGGTGDKCPNSCHKELLVGSKIEKNQKIVI